MWPGHRLALVCRKGLGDFFVKAGIVDQVYEIEKGHKATYARVVADLKNYQVDHLISPHESLRTVLFCAQIKARRKISFRNGCNFFVFGERVARDVRLPDALRQLSLLSFQDQQLGKDLADYVINAKPYLPGEFGQLQAPPAWGSMSLRSEVLRHEMTYRHLKEKFHLQGFDNKKAVLIFPGSVWATKRWTEEGFIGAGQALQQKGYQIYVMGGPGEETLSERVAVEIPGAVSLAGKTKVIESAQLIARAALVIGNDSASTHLASVCETPLIAVFGPTILEFGYRPWSADSYVVQKEHLPCRPCGKHGHKVCPIKTHVCMKDITAEEVLRTAGFILR